MEMIGKVRRMKLRDKLSHSAIAKATGPSRTTVKASARTLERIYHFACAAGWSELGQELRDAGFVAEQEALERE